MKTLICIDRDGTIDYDKELHFGRQKDWKKKIRILPGVIKGIKQLRKIPNSKIYIITNQAGVAVKNFPLLTQKRAHEVCRYVMNLLKKKGAGLDGYEISMKASPAYVKKHPEYEFNKKMVGNDACIKPNPGMIYKILKREKSDKRKTNIYVMGDRESDVKAGLRIGGHGILVPFVNRPGEPGKVRKIKNKKKYIAKSFLDAVRFILNAEHTLK